MATQLVQDSADQFPMPQEPPQRELHALLLTIQSENGIPSISAPVSFPCWRRCCSRNTTTGTLVWKLQRVHRTVHLAPRVTLQSCKFEHCCIHRGERHCSILPSYPHCDVDPAPALGLQPGVDFSGWTPHWEWTPNTWSRFDTSASVSPLHHSYTHPPEGRVQRHRDTPLACTYAVTQPIPPTTDP